MLLYKQGEDISVESFFSGIFNPLYDLYFWFFILETIQIHYCMTVSMLIDPAFVMLNCLQY